MFKKAPNVKDMLVNNIVRMENMLIGWQRIVQSLVVKAAKNETKNK